MASESRLECREFVELVTEYLEGALPPDERARFDAHIALCEGCGTYLEQMRQTIRAAGALTEESVPQPAMDELLRLFRGWKAER
jgi:anti-sigma factor RsiW